MYAKTKEFFQRRWWALPALSGLLLILTFHPFDFWPLGFVALAPLYCFAGGFGYSARRVLWGGMLCGGLFAFALSYYTIVQFHWLPETYLFVWMVRLLVVPVTFIGGAICGLSLVVFRALRGQNILLNAALAAAVYTLAELALSAIFGGYYLAALAYAAAPVPPLLSLAALGGEHLLSFVLALTGGLLAEALILGRVPWRTWGLALLFVALVGTPNYVYLHRALPAYRTLSVTVLQNGTRDPAVFGSEHNGRFFWEEADRLAGAAQGQPDLIIYPFSPVEGALVRGAAPAFNKDVLVASERAFGSFVGGALPTSTILLTWNNLYHDGHFYNEYELWQGGAVASEYQKRAMFPFMDYTPAWAAHLGLFSTPFDDTPGQPDNRLVLNGQSLGDLMCSELHNSDLARYEARRAPLIIAVGSEAMFLDDVASAFSLRAAQLRAAENDVPVVRGNILGPSGITDRFGNVVVETKAGERAQISARIALTAARATLFNRLGLWPLGVLLAAVFALAWHVSQKKRVGN